MGKIIANANSTLDGIFTGPKGDEGNMVSWAMPGIMDSNNDGLAMFQKADAILMGRVTCFRERRSCSEFDQWWIAG